MQHIYHFFFTFVLSKRLINSLSGSDVLEFMNIVSILFYNSLEFIMLLCYFLVLSFGRYKKITTFSGELPAFTCSRAIGNLSLDQLPL